MKRQIIHTTNVEDAPMTCLSFGRMRAGLASPRMAPAHRIRAGKLLPPFSCSAVVMVVVAVVVVVVVVVMVVVVATGFATKQSCLSSWNWTSQQLKCQNSNKTIQNAKTCQQGFKNDIHTHGSCVFEEPHQLKTNLATTHSCPETERLAPGIAHGLRIRIAQTASQVTLKLH